MVARRRCSPHRVMTVVCFAAWVTFAEGFLPLSRRPSTPVCTPRAPPRTRPTAVAVPPRLMMTTTTGHIITALASNNNDSNNTPGGGGGGVNNMDPSTKLLLCILIDLVGMASFAAPGLGEVTDVGWAPVSALLVNYLFGNGIFTALALVEELLPGFDIIPTATIAWFVENGNQLESTATSSSTAPPPPPKEASRAAPTPKRTEENTIKRPNISDAIDAEVID